MKESSSSHRLNATRSRKSLWFGLVVGTGAIGLCVCFILLAVIFFFRQDLPLVSRLFPVQTPVLSLYDNPIGGISFYQPVEWRYFDRCVSITNCYADFKFTEAEYEYVLNHPGQRTTGAGLTLAVMPLKTLGRKVDAATLSRSIDLMNNWDNDHEKIETFEVSGYPAAAALYTDPFGPGSDLSFYDVLVLRETDLVSLLFYCDHDKLAHYRPIFEKVTKSVKVVPVP